MKNEKKVSQMILDVAAQFIELGESEAERQTNLDIACTAWNLSILPKSKRNKEYYKYLDGMRVLIRDNNVMKYLREDLDGLIKAKLELYPNELNPIASATLKNIVSGDYQVTVSFYRKNQLH